VRARPRPQQLHIVSSSCCAAHPWCRSAETLHKMLCSCILPARTTCWCLVIV
jgi:hypothetical protein